MNNKATKIEENILDFEREIKELNMMFKDGRIPYSLLEMRIGEIFSYLKEDIKEEFNN